MTRPDPLTAIASDRLLVIVRLARPDDEVAGALLRSGVRIVEVSLTSGDALGTIARWRERYPELVVGAGTVLTLEDGRRAVEAGAEYLVSPNLDEEVCGWARDGGVAHVPGVFTPSELARALALGASLVKLFPAAALGPRYVRDLLAPFPGARLLATGGVDETNALEFLQAGATAVAVGGSVVREGLQPAEIGAAAAELRRLVGGSP